MSVGHIARLLSRLFNQYIDIIPSPGSSLTGQDHEVFTNLQMPLKSLYTKLVDKIECKMLSNKVAFLYIFHVQKDKY